MKKAGRKLNFKKLFLKYSIIAFILMMFVQTIAFAAPKGSMVLFCADWNSRCRDAKNVVQSVANSYGGSMNYRELNIDFSTTPDQARAMGLSVPRSIPYIFIIDANGNILKQQPYNGESVKQFKSQTDQLFQ